MLCSSIDVSGGRIYNNDTMGSGALHIDVVNTDTGTSNNFEFLCCAKQIRSHLSLRTNNESFVIADGSLELLGAQAFLLVYLELILK